MIQRQLKLITELTSIKNSTEVTSKKVLMWTKRVETQRLQIVMIESLQENRKFDAVRRNSRGKLNNDKIKTK